MKIEKRESVPAPGFEWVELGVPKPRPGDWSTGEPRHLVPSRIVHRLALAGGIEIEAVLQVSDDGVPGCVDVRTRSTDPRRPLGNDDLPRALHGFTRTAFESLVSIEVWGGTTVEDWFGVEYVRVDGSTARREVGQARVGRPPTVTRSELEQVAKIYREHIRTKPVAAVRRLGGYSARTASRRVEMARKAGLLPTTRPGQKRG